MDQVTNPPLTTSSICDTLGRRQIAERIGVGLTAVSLASVTGIFPASWFDTLQEMCAEAGIQCPRNLFRWKRANAPAETQGAA